MLFRSHMEKLLRKQTTGPLFGSFKLEHHVYTGPVRLYNSWLHNNRTKIGLNMEQVKLPQMKVNIKTLFDTPSNEEKQWIQVNPSCLLAYLGIRGYANTPKSGEKVVNKNALPILTYFDIFKKLLCKHTRRKFLHDWKLSQNNNANKRRKYTRQRQYTSSFRRDNIRQFNNIESQNANKR